MNSERISPPGTTPLPGIGVEVSSFLRLSVLCAVAGASSLERPFTFLNSLCPFLAQALVFSLLESYTRFAAGFSAFRHLPSSYSGRLSAGGCYNSPTICVCPAPKPLSMACDPSNPVELLSLVLKTFLLSPNLTFGTYLQSY